MKKTTKKIKKTTKKKEAIRKKSIQFDWHVFSSLPNQRRKSIMDLETNQIIKKIEEERISRNLHNGLKLHEMQDDTALYEQFVVVGIDSINKNKPETLFTYPNSEEEGKYFQLPLEFPSFCFPKATETKANKIKRSSSNSKLLELFYSASHDFEEVNKFVFLINGGEDGQKTYYVSCLVVPNELVEVKPGLRSAKINKEMVNNEKGVLEFSGAARAYCFVSFFPFFSLHFKVLNEILNEVRCQKFALDQKIKIFASPSFSSFSSNVNGLDYLRHNHQNSNDKNGNNGSNGNNGNIGNKKSNSEYNYSSFSSVNYSNYNSTNSHISFNPSHSDTFPSIPNKTPFLTGTNNNNNNSINSNNNNNNSTKASSYSNINKVENNENFILSTKDRNSYSVTSTKDRNSSNNMSNMSNMSSNNNDFKLNFASSSKTVLNENFILSLPNKSTLHIVPSNNNNVNSNNNGSNSSNNSNSSNENNTKNNGNNFETYYHLSDSIMLIRKTSSDNNNVDMENNPFRSISNENISSQPFFSSPLYPHHNNESGEERKDSSTPTVSSQQQQQQQQQQINFLKSIKEEESGDEIDFSSSSSTSSSLYVNNANNVNTRKEINKSGNDFTNFNNFNNDRGDEVRGDVMKSILNKSVNDVDNVDLVDKMGNIVRVVNGKIENVKDLNNNIHLSPNTPYDNSNPHYLSNLTNTNININTSNLKNRKHSTHRRSSSVQIYKHQPSLLLPNTHNNNDNNNDNDKNDNNVNDKNDNNVKEEENKSETKEKKKKGELQKILDDYLLSRKKMEENGGVKIRNLFIEHTKEEFEEESYMIGKWCLPLFFCSIPISSIHKLLAVVLLERKLIIISENLRLLSNTVLSLLCLLRPFVYQSVVLPFLPLHLTDFLDAIVPFIIGMPYLPKFHVPSKDIFYYNADKNEWFGCYNSSSKEKFDTVLPALPFMEKLNVENNLQMLKNSFLNDKKPKTAHPSKNSSPNTTPPLFISKYQSELTFLCAEQFKSFFTNLFINFSKHCVRDKTDKKNIISIFLPESFLLDLVNTRPKNIGKLEASFFQSFFQTQIFNEFSERKRSVDEKSLSSQNIKKENK